MEWTQRVIWLLAGALVAQTLSWFYPRSDGWSLLFVTTALIVLFVQIKTTHNTSRFKPKSKQYKAIQTIKNKELKSEQLKFVQINDQFNFIEYHWGYTQAQKSVVESYLKQKVYLKSFHRLNASLLPQIIEMIEQCEEHGQKGCKRAVANRIKELIKIIKQELSKHQLEKKEQLETTIEVYDQLLKY